MAKLELDKYYTPLDVAKRCIEKTYEVIGKENIKDIIEPSAGNGSFSLQIENCKAYDIKPEHKSIIEKDFFDLEESYKEGRLIIGNPPYGEKMVLAKRFYKKAVTLGDYIAFILPISMLNNSNSLYEFDLIDSIDLGKVKFSGREVHCCYNIYKRPVNGKCNKRKVAEIKSIEIIRQDSKRYKESPYDLRMSYWGFNAGKILEDGESYTAEYKIIIKNEEYREEIIKALRDVDWTKELNFTAMKRIQQFHIINYLKKRIAGLE